MKIERFDYQYVINGIPELIQQISPVILVIIYIVILDKLQIIY